MASGRFGSADMERADPLGQVSDSESEQVDDQMAIDWATGDWAFLENDDDYAQIDHVYTPDLSFEIEENDAEKREDRSADSDGGSKGKGEWSPLRGQCSQMTCAD